MAAPWVRVIADDLTGACDVGAALLPWPRRIVVRSLERSAGSDDDALVVRNTQSRTCARDVAAARVRAALAGAPAERPGMVLKKIDTALRGWLGAEIDAAMDAIGAEAALVVPAIPDVGRTTVGGHQLIEGVPVHQTAFARDPQNPVRDAHVAAVIASTSRRRARSATLAEGARAAIEQARADGGIVVGDAETDEDLRRWVTAAIDLAASEGVSLVLGGSTGLARAWRATCAPATPRAVTASCAAGAGILVVSGSAHPTTAGQLAHLASARGAHVTAIDATDVDAAVARLQAGDTVCLTAPEADAAGGSEAVLEMIASGASAVLERTRPGAMIVVGGETAYHLLARLGHPELTIEGAPAPLVVRATIADGRLAGLPLVTKGGSTGPAERLADLLDEVRR